jgi:hypothetical protein
VRLNGHVPLEFLIHAFDGVAGAHSPLMWTSAVIR